MKLLEEIAKAKPAAVKRMVEKTGCTEAEAVAAYDNCAKNRVKAALANLANKELARPFNEYSNARWMEEEASPERQAKRRARQEADRKRAEASGGFFRS